MLVLVLACSKTPVTPPAAQPSKSAPANIRLVWQPEAKKLPPGATLLFADFYRAIDAKEWDRAIEFYDAAYRNEQMKFLKDGTDREVRYQFLHEGLGVSRSGLVAGVQPEEIDWLRDLESLREVEFVSFDPPDPYISFKEGDTMLPVNAFVSFADGRKYKVKLYVLRLDGTFHLLAAGG